MYLNNVNNVPILCLKCTEKSVLTTIVFVLTVLTVSVEVALPPQGDALAVLAALELIASATLTGPAVTCQNKK